MSDIKALREKRGKLVADMRAMLDAATAEGRDLSDEEQTKYNTMADSQEALRSKIDTEQRQRDLDREMAEKIADDEQRAKPGKPAGESEDRAKLAVDGLRQWMKTGAVTPEFRALQVNNDASGGYLVPGEQFVAQLIKAVDDETFMRRLGTVFTVGNADGLGVPTLEADPADAAWTSEIATGNEDSTMSFGKRELHPFPLAKLIKVSNKLLAKSVLPAEQLVTGRLAYKFAISEEKAFLTGSGASQPLGIFTASADGVPTSQDVSTGNASTSIQFDGLIEAKYKLKSNYWPRAQWLFHQDAMKQISKLKDGEGQYLWRMSVRDGEPDTVLGRPVNVSQYAPNTFTTGQYVGMFADFSQYWIADSIAMGMQRLVELYAATNQVGFIGRLEVDGMPVLAEAFARVKLG